LVRAIHVLSIAVLSTLAMALPARADGLEVYPPDQQSEVYALEVHGAVVLPLEASTVCPAGGDCVIGGGFGAGGIFVRRTPDGIGLLVGYEVWLLDGNGVYEVAALHSLRLGVRWILDDSSRVQPLLQATAGAILLTDPGQATSAGGMLTVGGGMEIELTTDVSVSLAAELAFLALAPFRTRDGVDRAANFGVNVALETTVGLIVLLGQSGAR
jgi:hypothetical protein